MSLSPREANFVKKKVPKTDEEYERIRKSVENNFMFQSVSDKDLRDIFDAMFEKKVKASEVVIKQVCLCHPIVVAWHDN